MAQKMSDEEWRAFVSNGTRTGKLSTVRADEFGTRNGVPGELLVRIRVEKVVAYSAVAE
jgi:hypothetical protein